MTKLADQTYQLLKKVPKGRVTTYKALAQGLGTKAYRAIGQIMKKNPDAPNTPCHRVVASNGTIGGFMGKTQGETIAKKIKLLTQEGVQISGNKIVDFKKVLFEFK